MHHQTSEAAQAAPTIQDIEDYTLAAAEGEISIVEQFLLRYPKHIDATNAHSWTALMHAAWNDQEAVVSLLLSKDADRDLQDRWGRTAWILARKQGHKNIMALIRQPLIHNIFDAGK